MSSIDGTVTPRPIGYRSKIILFNRPLSRAGLLKTMFNVDWTILYLDLGPISCTLYHGFIGYRPYM